jgi:hypothetical protein
MAQKTLLSSVFFTALAHAVLAQPVRAEVACVAEVSYRWVKEQAAATDAGSAASAPAKGGSGGSASAKAAESPAPVEAGPAGGEQRVRFAQVERRGQDERSVKAGLQIEVSRQKSRAHDRCKRDHESFGDCVSTKMATKVGSLNSLSFSARSKVEEALIEECRIQQGRCVAIDSEEPTCRDLATGAAPEAAGGPGGASEGAKAAVDETKGASKDAAKPSEPAADKAKSAKKKP